MPKLYLPTIFGLIFLLQKSFLLGFQTSCLPLIKRGVFKDPSPETMNLTKLLGQDHLLGAAVVTSNQLVEVDA
jgi:hypothetical protein